MTAHQHDWVLMHQTTQVTEDGKRQLVTTSQCSLCGHSRITLRKRRGHIGPFWFRYSHVGKRWYGTIGTMGRGESDAAFKARTEQQLRDKLARHIRKQRVTPS